VSNQTETAFIRFTMDRRENPRIVSFVEKKQGVDQLNPNDLVPVRQEKKPVRNADVKQNCIKLAEKYLSETARRFYSSLAGTDRDIDDEDP